MTPTQKNALIALGCTVILFLVGVYAWGYKVNGTGSVKIYVMKGVDSAGNLAYGFACKCETTPQGTRWIGASDGDCDSTNPGDKDYPFTLSAVGEGNKPIPTGACCRNKPRINTTVLVNKNDSTCLN